MIPDFDHNNVIPPHLGNPAVMTDLSPYPCNSLEICQKLGTTKERVEILKGLIVFRQRMMENGIVDGFQWLDGSFIENIEVTENRPPNDLDLVTFFGGLTIEEQKVKRTKFIEFFNPTLAKNNYKLDHYFVDYSFRPEVTIEMTRYWIQLFTHNRLGVWKGILRLELNTAEIDQEALTYLKNVEL